MKHAGGRLHDAARASSPAIAEKQALFRARDAFHIKNNDALWLLLAVLGHYETLYAQFPALISRAATDVTEKVRATADAELKAAVARSRSELARSLAQTAHQIAGQVASAARWWAVTWAVLVTVAAFVGTAAAMYRVGRASGSATGQREGYDRARDEKAANAWANTPEGQLGYALAQAGSLRDLATCSGKAFVRRGTVCFVKPGRDPIFGWRVAP